MKLRSALLLVVTATVCALSGLLTPQVASASVDAVTQWPKMPPIVSDSANGNLSGKFTVGAGNNRLLLVAVATEYTSGNPTITSVTYGGTALTNIAAATNTTGANKIWVGYLVLGTGTVPSTATLAVTNTGTAGLTATYVTAAVYKGVDQTTPITGSGSASGSTATLTTANFAVTGISGNNGLAVFISNFSGATLNTTGTATKVREYAGTNMNIGAGQETIVTNPADNLTVTASAAVSGVLAGIGLNPAIKIATNTTCGDCHGNPPQDATSRNVPSGQFPGAHDKHTGGNANQYSLACTVCHYNAVGYSHSTGYKNISGSKVPRNSYGGVTNIAASNTPAYTQTCTKSTCHSNGRTNIQYAASPVWTGTTTCLSCHGGRSASGLNRYTTSTARFKLSTTHGQHLSKYTVAQINCNTCHGKTAANNTALVNYTGTIYHADGSKTVTFTNIAYGSYTAYKAASKTCQNVSCHGGKSRGTWNENTSVNTNNTCSHCHGTSTASASLQNVAANRKFFAPGYKSTGNPTGTSTDQIANSNDYRVGAHFKHISSAYMKSIRCNECHTVPSNPFDSTHMQGNRFNSQTLTFAQASTATISIGVSSASTPTLLSAFSGYTSGNGTRAASCSSVYCHGSRLKNGAAGGTYTKPYWNYSAMINYTDKVNACARCHGNPPSSVSASHSGKTPTTSCSGCHGSVVDASGNIINKNLHINGRVEGGGHAYPYPGATHGPSAGAASYSACTGCHTNWNAAANTYPFTRGDALQVTCKTCHKGTTFNTASQGCADCHGDSTGRPSNNTSVGGNVFPNISGSHGKHVVVKGYACSVCHATYGTGSPDHGSSGGKLSQQTVAYVHVTSATRQFGDFTYTKKDHVTAGKGSCANNACHGLAEWGVDKLDCISCHSSAMTIANGPLAGGQRAAVAASIKASGTRNHKSTAVGSDASKWDCIVCHMEGDTTTGATSSAIGSVAGKTIHGDGVIDFRDPDTGNQIKKVKWNGATFAQNLNDPGGRYADTLTNLTTARFSRNLSVVLESDPNWLDIASIQMNLCLKCHDNNGAMSANAQSKNPAVSATVSNYKPFGLDAASTTTQYWVTTTLKTAAGNTTGAVMNVFSQLSSGNSSYHPVRARQNNNSVTGSALKAPWGNTTKATGGRFPANTIYGYLVSCFDCHAASGATGQQNSTVVAHGNTAGTTPTMRSGRMTTTAVSGGATNLCTVCHGDNYTLSGGHGSGSGVASLSTSMNATTLGTCSNCHGSTTNNIGAQAVNGHGFNALESTGGATFATSGQRPYAFFRGGSMTNWNYNTPTCTVSCTTGTYSPGGMY